MQALRMAVQLAESVSGLLWGEMAGAATGTSAVSGRA